MTQLTGGRDAVHYGVERSLSFLPERPTVPRINTETEP